MTENDYVNFSRNVPLSKKPSKHVTNSTVAGRGRASAQPQPVHRDPQNVLLVARLYDIVREQADTLER